MNGERIRNLRKNKKGWSQEELAQQTNTHANTIARWERNVLEPSGEAVAKLAQVLGTTADYLLDLTDDPAPGGGASMIAPLVNASSATVNAPIAAGHDHVIATTTPQIITPDFSSIPQLAMQMKKQGNIAEMKDAIDLLESSLSMLRRAVQESAPA